MIHMSYYGKCRWNRAQHNVNCCCYDFGVAAGANAVACSLQHYRYGLLLMILILFLFQLCHRRLLLLWCLLFTNSDCAI